MPFLSQTNFPRLWLLMQKTIGGNADKKSLAVEHYDGQKRVLEIGCSVGNISEVFTQFPGISFTGIDIDGNALTLARQRFASIDNFRFTEISLEKLSQMGEKFDYVLFAGILHHVNDATASRLLQFAHACLDSEATLVVYEPEAISSSDGWLLRIFCRLFEQGAFLRSRSELVALVEAAGISLEKIEDRNISPGIVRRPFVARFNLLKGRARREKLA